MKLLFLLAIREFRGNLSRPIVLVRPVPRPCEWHKGPVSTRAAKGLPELSAHDVTAAGWFWRLAFGCGLASALVLGAEFLSAAPLVEGPRGAATSAPESAAGIGRKPSATTTERIEAAQVSKRGEPLRLTGTLVLDPNCLSRVHARFAGQVMELGRCETADALEPSRPLRYGDAVKKDQLLAVLWSREVGEKKSDLISATTKLALCQAQFEHLNSLETGVVPIKTVMDARRKYESALIAAQRAERTLRSWRLSDREIDEVLAEAERAQYPNGADRPITNDDWAKLEIRAPLDGVILEQNVSAGDLVKVGKSMFMIGDLSTLGVIADVFEEDLPRVESLGPGERTWTVFVASHTQGDGIPGQFDVIGSIVDPRKHTTTIFGRVSNAAGNLRIGQLIQAEIRPAAATAQTAGKTLAEAMLPGDPRANRAALQTARGGMQKAGASGQSSIRAERADERLADR